MSSPPSPTTTPARWLDRLSERQTVLLILLFGVLLYVPFAGSYGLWDPWETHYGEVARQMTSRHDYVGLFWPGSPLDRDVFWSKPVLTFWIMSFAMSIAGIGGAHSPPGQLALSSTTEWALRTPFCLLALTALYGVYLVASRFVSRRAGVLAAVVLGTMPMFSLVARQAMTDMPFVGPMTLALALCALALFDESKEELPRKQWHGISWPHHASFYIAVGLLLATAVPQIIVDAVNIRWRVRLGSLHFVMPGVSVMVPYIAGVIAFLYYVVKARYRAPLYLVIAGVLAALATLAKGLAGLGLPVIVLFAYLAFTWNWRRLARPQIVFGLSVALLACLVVAVPWHHAMLVRFGKGFWNELYGDNHWRRLVLGRHGDRGTFEYFLRELGFAVLPWLTLAPAALAWVIMRPFKAPGDQAPQPGAYRQEIFWFGAIWFVAAYGVVSLSMTKFHHYILPALPGLALAIACFLDDILERGRVLAVRLVALVGIPLLALVTWDLVRTQNAAQRFIWLFSYDYVNDPKGRAWPAALDYRSWLLGAGVAFAVATLLLIGPRLRRLGTVALCGCAVVFTYFLLDVYMKQVSDIWSQKGLLATYYKERRGPEEPLIAWQMYWRGETFYSQNEIYEGPSDKRTVFLGTRNAEDLQAYLARNSGKRVFFVVEKARFEKLKTLLADGPRQSLKVLNDTNNKFELVTAQL
ncbi:MAG: glycosyltransferase family 39 protein [Deltaproteobacteria bacterium]|nr:glycosyltransferase family 39 protein [Deltaproteobacteria bacterium]